jgi:ribonuclease VapC
LIVLDSSALVAIAQDEPESDPFLDVIERSRCLVGTPTLVECHLVLRSRGFVAAIELLNALATSDNVTIVAFDAAHYRLACDAFDRYGKGRGHPAQLNFGDCLSYAVAKFQDAPLLFKGEDFRHTDLRSASP